MASGELFFSIIIPTWNRADLIAETLHSVLDQKNIPLELIIVDDGSTDHTPSVVASFIDARIKYIKIANSERGAARNAGRKVASGKYVNYFDSDDTFCPCLDKVKTFILESNSPPVVYGSIMNVSDDGSDLGIVDRRGKDFGSAIRYNNFLACGSVFIKMEVAEVFPFSEDRNLSGTEDWELWLRIFSSHDFLECPLVVFNQRHHHSRSLVASRHQQVIDREQTFIAHVKNEWVALRKRFSASELDLFIAERQTFIALTYSEDGNRRMAYSWLTCAIRTSLSVLRRKRTWAIGKQLILGANA